MLYNSAPTAPTIRPDHPLQLPAPTTRPDHPFQATFKTQTWCWQNAKIGQNGQKAPICSDSTRSKFPTQPTAPTTRSMHPTRPPVPTTHSKQLLRPPVPTIRSKHPTRPPIPTPDLTPHLGLGLLAGLSMVVGRSTGVRSTLPSSLTLDPRGEEGAAVREAGGGPPSGDLGISIKPLNIWRVVYHGKSKVWVVKCLVARCLRTFLSGNTR